MAYLILLIFVMASVFLVFTEGVLSGVIAAVISVIVNVLLFGVVKRKIGIRLIAYNIAVFACLLILYVNFTQL